MRLAVRAASASDAAEMGQIHVAAWRAAYAGLMGAEFLAQLDPERGEKWWHQVLSGRSSAPGEAADPAPWAHLVVELDGRVVAMSTVGPSRDSEPGLPDGELWMLNAHPDAFGTGAATALHREALAALAGNGASAAYLWVARDNPRARRFYEREGWRADGGEKTQAFGGVDVAEVRCVRDL